MSEQRAKKRAKVVAQPEAEEAALACVPEPGGVSSFLQSWAWKREHRPDRDRFQRPYVHPLADGRKLTVEQARFKGSEGFASTVWDSSIVVAKYLERHAGTLVLGRRLLDLSAGCGLPGLTAAALGAAAVVATDLPPNLPLLRRNAERNGLADVVTVAEHWWGSDVAALEAAAEAASGGSGRGGFDLVLACDVMYVEEAVPALVSSLAALCGGSYSPPPSAPQGQQPQGQEPQGQQPQGQEPAAAPATEQQCQDGARDNRKTSAEGADGPSPCTGGGAGGGGGTRTRHSRDDGQMTVVLLAHGRNRFAEAAFWRHAGAAGLEAERVPAAEMDAVYQCSDVDVFKLRLGLGAQLGRSVGGSGRAAAEAEADEAEVEGGARQERKDREVLTLAEAGGPGKGPRKAEKQKKYAARLEGA
ncbi:hypothetical protein HYH02_010009 [Chlamydomonas schloesseri]|uniref:Uncharacterized protein n=1 Tax=Chlamydomonas schloesseri TaxID=2026947 RepID=A0A835TC94_9CHLO|nr:hypothetical protein HYH02_010009 [Chlamydomonas schloesseri]|eukprot:KAG2441421.1 hypothetical protein HYH02_010009 [Chlamydomonas schloesseri]